MDADLVIRSRQNSLLKRAGAVGAGKEEGRFLLEGERLIRDALGAGVELEVVLVAEDDMALAGDLAADGVEVRLVEPALLQQASKLKTSPGSMALGVTPELRSVSFAWCSNLGDGAAASLSACARLESVLSRVLNE